MVGAKYGKESDMKYEVLRISSGKDSTSGMLFEINNGKRTFLAYTLEDEQRDVKVWGETRIPAGTYKLKLRTEGGFHTRYSGKYGAFHKGMIHVQDVPGFEYILWHTGNTDEHTAGCLILGNTQTNNRIAKDGFIGSSVDAYKFVYPRVAAAIEAGLDVEVTYIDYDGDIQESTQEPVKDDIMEKLQEISGEVQILSAKLDGRNIV
jgi:hypothetical protein